jgi:hypothetical protein
MKIRWFVGLVVTADGRIIRETYNADGTVRSRGELR